MQNNKSDEETERELEALGYLETTKGSKDWWRRRVKKYNGLHWAKSEDYLTHLINFINPQKNDTILEIGTGTGIVANALAKKCAAVVTIDNSKSMISKFCKKGKNIDVRLGDARAMLFPDSSFDKVVARLVLHHILVDLNKVFKEAARVLRPGGVFVVSEGVPPDYHLEVMQDYKDIFKLKEQRLTFTEQSLKKMFKPLFMKIETDYFWQRGMSFRNWINGDSHLGKKQKEKIFQFRKNSSSRVKRAYNLKESGNDLLVDFRILNIKATPKAKR